MTASVPQSHLQRPFWVGIRDAIPLLGGYVPVAISFGMIATQAGFSLWETVFISTVIYAGASQFLFVAMVASGAPLWLVVTMTLLINARHLVYGPNIAPWLPRNRTGFWLMHGLTDQIFALALSRLPQIPEQQRQDWFSGAMLLAWFSWVAGSAAGVLSGAQLITYWPLLADVLPFALPALFLVLLLPKLNSWIWFITLGSTLLSALLLQVFGWVNSAIPLAALLGVLLFYAVNTLQLNRRNSHD
ncbi:MAG: AzlC family ABC transporter permease [Saccharospirillaceae bacterium]|nr:AzlC family ABC transporter permease [Saccharospirillaceae bacterium]